VIIDALLEAVWSNPKNISAFHRELRTCGPFTGTEAGLVDPHITAFPVVRPLPMYTGQHYGAEELSPRLPYCAVCLAFFPQE
jgi:hypothetical protein